MLVQVVYLCIRLLQDWNFIFVSQLLAGSGNVLVCVFVSCFQVLGKKLGKSADLCTDGRSAVKNSIFRCKTGCIIKILLLNLLLQ